MHVAVFCVLQASCSPPSSLGSPATLLPSWETTLRCQVRRQSSGKSILSIHTLHQHPISTALTVGEHDNPQVPGEKAAEQRQEKCGYLLCTAFLSCHNGDACVSCCCPS
jgi:hypothetical protein